MGRTLSNPVCNIGNCANANERENDIMPDETDTVSGAAARALEEAKARRKRETPHRMPKELGGRKGPEPTRYGDWEKNGIVSDF